MTIKENTEKQKLILDEENSNLWKTMIMTCVEKEIGKKNKKLLNRLNISNLLTKRITVSYHDYVLTITWITYLRKVST